MDKFLYYEDNDDIFCYRLADNTTIPKLMMDKFDMKMIKIQKIDRGSSDSIAEACHISRALFRSFHHNIDPAHVARAYQKTEVLTAEGIEEIIISHIEKEGFIFKNSKEFGTIVYTPNGKKIGELSYDLKSYTVKTDKFKLHKTKNYTCICGDITYAESKDLLNEIFYPVACSTM